MSDEHTRIDSDFLVEFRTFAVHSVMFLWFDGGYVESVIVDREFFTKYG